MLGYFIFSIWVWHYMKDLEWPVRGQFFAHLSYHRNMETETRFKAIILFNNKEIKHEQKETLCSTIDSKDGTLLYQTIPFVKWELTNSKAVCQQKNNGISLFTIGLGRRPSSLTTHSIHIQRLAYVEPKPLVQDSHWS